MGRLDDYLITFTIMSFPLSSPPQKEILIIGEPLLEEQFTQTIKAVHLLKQLIILFLVLDLNSSELGVEAHLIE